MPPAFDPAMRKTVSCPVLEAAFNKNPHPDGKTMNALAEKLKLNKKQVSNFFERERRKANIVIESRRKGPNGGGSSGNSSSSGSISGSATKPASHKKKNNTSPPTGSNFPSAAKKQHDDASSTAIASKNRDNIDTAMSDTTQRRARRTVKSGAYYRAFDDSDEDEGDEADGDGEEEEDLDAEGEDYEDDNTGEYDEENGTPASKKTRSEAVIEDVEDFGHLLESVIQQAQQNPLVQKNKLESSLARSSTGTTASSSRYAARNARYASRSPLYAFPAAHAPDNFRTAPAHPQQQQPVTRRTVSASPSIGARSVSPLTAGTGHAQTQINTLLTAFATSSKSTHLAAPPSLYILKHGSRATSPGDGDTSAVEGSSTSKRKRGIALSESPTVLFLRNPFPAPVSSHQATQGDYPRYDLTSSTALQSVTMMGEEDFGNFLNDHGVSEFILDPCQPMMRKRARVWFSKPSNEGESAELSNESFTNSASQESPKSRPANSNGETTQNYVSKPRSTRTAAAKRPENAKSRSSGLDLSDADLNSSDDSEFANDDDLDMKNKKKRDNRPGAALRSNIACNELKQAFLADPHPAAHVLEALAIRLGLGKKQVSNYFVRERKKAGFTIKVRHGLHRRRGPNKKKFDRPEVVVTQHDVNLPAETSQTAQSNSQTLEEANMFSVTGDEDDADSDDGESNIGSQMDDMAVDSYTGNIDPALLGSKDDVPDLSYDEQDIAASMRKVVQGMHNSNTSGGMSSLMVISKSMESMTTSSRQDEDEELASPPFEAVQLPPTGGDDKAPHVLPTSMFSYGAHVLPANPSLQYM